ncbi:hypothetical protein [uncultured Williamsia sp.]|uniref:hypothetical protein n=1 Tax=uncultured Williamsia sp. TaxID=259311 RepID=UPI0026266028|nr:hypothetical protein [uncultured Williamsia sp.]
MPSDDDLAARLRSAAAVIAAVVGGDADAPRPMSAVAATDALQEALDESRRETVARARAAGHTWAEIGALLHISRQAAQQRFGKTSPNADDLAADRIVARTRQIAGQFIDHDFAGIRSDWSQVMLDGIDESALATLWTGLERDGGPVQTLGKPVVGVRGPYRVVDLPLVLTYGPMWLTVSFAHDDSVAGLWVKTTPTVEEK